jgi:hypothetical protein
VVLPDLDFKDDHLTINKNLTFDKLCLGNTTLQNSTNNPNIEGTNLATGYGGEEMTKIISIKIRHLINCALAAQHYRTKLAIQRLRVRILPLAMGKRK